MCVCVCVFANCFQFLSFAFDKVETASVFFFFFFHFFSSSDASDLSCFSEPRQLYRCINQLIMYINHQDILIYFVAKLLLYII